MLRKHLSYYDFDPDKVVLLGNVLYYAKKAEFEFAGLEAENAKLREERDHYKALWEHAIVTDCELRRVRAAWKEDREKNAKLRELVRTFYMCSDIRCNQCEYGYGDTCAFDAEAELLELGIEVDR
jgi:hypothetical protein